VSNGGGQLPSVRWIENIDLGTEEIKTRSGGDLARFLKLEDYLHDTDVSRNITFPQGFSVQSRSYFDSVQKAVPAGLLFPSQKEPLLVESFNALNEKRVLWLRDSFGTQLSPLMTLTYGQVVHWHYGKSFKQQQLLRELLEKFKPEIIIMTVVERESLHGLLIPPKPEVFERG